LGGATCVKNSFNPLWREGRTKLAKLDFLLRYPEFLARAFAIRRPQIKVTIREEETSNIEGGMIRYRYGPWDPSYYATLGILVGKGLVRPIPTTGGIGYRSTEAGHSLAQKIAENESWADVAARTKLLRRHFDLSGTSLKDFIYEHFPEVAGASWGKKL
jgi:hypothetical protein